MKLLGITTQLVGRAPLPGIKCWPLQRLPGFNLFEGWKLSLPLDRLTRWRARLTTSVPNGNFVRILPPDEDSNWPDCLYRWKTSSRGPGEGVRALASYYLPNVIKGGGGGGDGGSYDLSPAESSKNSLARTTTIALPFCLDGNHLGLSQPRRFLDFPAAKIATRPCSAGMSSVCHKRINLNERSDLSPGNRKGGESFLGRH